jgi:RNA polymerase sigma-70 factor, ECF subfamily
MSNPVAEPTTASTLESFDDVVLPHLDAGYRLARWLTRSEEDAEDVVQEASLRALRYFRTFTGGNGRAWFLRIVRNTCAGWYGPRLQVATDPFDEERHSSVEPTNDPETLLLDMDAASAIEQAMRALPDRFRDLLVLRELEGLSYREVAHAMNIPMGTVMSGLSRARQALRSALDGESSGFKTPERTRARVRDSDACRMDGENARRTAPSFETGSAAAAIRTHPVREEENS